MQPNLDRASHTFVIVEPDPIVSMDLVGVVQTAFPDGQIRLFKTVQDSLDVFADHDPKTASLLVNGRLATTQTVEVVASVVQAGGSLLWIGTPVAPVTVGTAVDLPFTTEMIVQALS